jgi:uncharacterized membrane protein YgcG
LKIYKYNGTSVSEYWTLPNATNFGIDMMSAIGNYVYYGYADYATSNYTIVRAVLSDLNNTRTTMYSYAHQTFAHRGGFASNISHLFWIDGDTNVTLYALDLATKVRSSFITFYRTPPKLWVTPGELTVVGDWLYFTLEDYLSNNGIFRINILNFDPQNVLLQSKKYSGSATGGLSILSVGTEQENATACVSDILLPVPVTSTTASITNTNTDTTTVSTSTSTSASSSDTSGSSSSSSSSNSSSSSSSSSSSGSTSSTGSSSSSSSSSPNTGTGTSVAPKIQGSMIIVLLVNLFLCYLV